MSLHERIADSAQYEGCMPKVLTVWVCRGKELLLQDVQRQKQKIAGLKRCKDSSTVSPEASNVSAQVSHHSLLELNFSVQHP